MSAAVSGPAAGLLPGEPVADLTIWLLEGGDPSRPDEAQILIQSPHLQPVSGTWRAPADLAARLDGRYSEFAQRVSRGAAALGLDASATTAEAAGPEQHRQHNLNVLREFGQGLYQDAAPPLFRDALAALQGKLGGDLRAIQVYTNNPRLPWELLVPPAAPGQEPQFLGVRYRLARWHVPSQITGKEGILMRPTARLELQGVYVVAPSYRGQMVLPAQQKELGAIREHASGLYRPVPGTLAAVKTLMSGEKAKGLSVVHFAGHGDASAQAAVGRPEFKIRLEDAELPLADWRRLASRWGGAHPLVFFNACEVGRAERSAGQIDGWGPAVLETGASGYIGGLWPLGDTAASEAAQAFYKAILSGAGISVAEALRQVRDRFYLTGDPTYLAYVFYGDVGLQVAGGPSEAIDPGQRLALPPPQVSGPLSAEVVRRIMRRNFNALRYCLESQSTDLPGLSGAAELQIVIDPEGQVRAVAVRSSNLERPGIAACWAARLRSMQFPAAGQGGITMVQQRFLVREP